MSFRVNDIHLNSGQRVLSDRKRKYSLIDKDGKYNVGDKIKFIFFKKKLERCYHDNTSITDSPVMGYLYDKCLCCGKVLKTLDTLTKEERKIETSYRFAMSHASEMKYRIKEYERKIEELKTKEYQHDIHLVKWNPKKQNYDITLNENAEKGSKYFYENYM